MSSDDGKRKKRQKDEEKSVGAVCSDKDLGKKADEIERKRKLLNKIRCKRYRDKKKWIK